MRALLLAGGRGTRLLPYTAVLPKPLVPVGELPVMEILLRQLAAAGVVTGRAADRLHPHHRGVVAHRDRARRRDGEADAAHRAGRGLRAVVVA